MKKKYEQDNKTQPWIIKEPMAEYKKCKKLSTPLSEEELKNSLSTEEV